MNALASILLAASDGASLWHALARSIGDQFDKQANQAPIIIAVIVIVVLLTWINIRLAIRLVRGPKKT